MSKGIAEMAQEHEATIDQQARAIADLEYRMRSVEGLIIKLMAKAFPAEMESASQDTTWCKCGREICRAPRCPSYEHDPLGR